MEQLNLDLEDIPLAAGDWQRYANGSADPSQAAPGTYNFEVADTAMLFTLFGMYEKESKRVLDKGLVLPALDYCLKCSHTFNLLDARGAISVTERTSYIHRVRDLCRGCAEAYVAQREALGYPLMDKNIIEDQVGLTGGDGS